MSLPNHPQASARFPTVSFDNENKSTPPGKGAPVPRANAKMQPGGTPADVRQARSKKALLKSGGKRITINLAAAALADLEAVKARYGTERTSSTGAIVLALKVAATAS